MAEFKIKKIDARYNGSGYFTHVIDYFGKYNESLSFQQHRAWFWESFGPSCEIEAFMRFGRLHDEPIDCISGRWAWNTEYGNRKIYVSDEATLAFFTLKFST